MIKDVAQNWLVNPNSETKAPLLLILREFSQRQINETQIV